MDKARQQEMSISGAEQKGALIWCMASVCLVVGMFFDAMPAAAQIKLPAPQVDKAPEEAEPKQDPGKDAAKPQPKTKPGIGEPEGSMTLTRMGEIIQRLDPKAIAPRPGSWQFKISERPVIIVTDPLHNRMRIMSPVAKVDVLPEDALQRMMQANFDTALDARYAIARGVVWATFIHPLSELHDRQFISGIGQTVNLALTFGKTFSSGAMAFGGGDSRDIIRKKLIEDLQKKGLPI